MPRGQSMLRFGQNGIDSALYQLGKSPYDWKKEKIGAAVPQSAEVGKRGDVKGAKDVVEVGSGETIDEDVGPFLGCIIFFLHLDIAEKTSLAMMGVMKRLACFPSSLVLG